MVLGNILSAINFAAAFLLAIYGLNSFVLSGIYLVVRRRTPAPVVDGALPRVTVQLPLYNERWVVARLINAVAALDYPRQLLEVQVLDDSTDSTTSIAASLVERWRRRGLDITLLHRGERPGYKAGALAAALPQARGEFVAIFDADFLPPRDWLKRVVPHFRGDPRLGFVQTRWGHLNGAYSPVTRAQALALDGHFIIEQTARQRGGLLMNFNGTAGIWRRACVEECGGWSARTLSEDLDLSYRAQLQGWHCLYLPDVVAPAELPPTVSSFKRQQRRWATGSVQCLRHLVVPLLRSGTTFWQKLEGVVHLSGYLCHPLMLVLLLLSLPLMLVNGGIRYHLTFLGIASMGPPLLYVLSQAVQGMAGVKRLIYFPVLVALGTGMALSNTLAVLRALRHDGGEFERTPKYRLVGSAGKWRGRFYSQGRDLTTLGETALAGYALVTMALAWERGNYYTLPFLALYVIGFAYVVLESIAETRSGSGLARREKPALESATVE
ncbi:MAG: cellulose synthase family protein [Anaerolineae bacterium]